MLDIAHNLSASASMHALTGSSRPGAVPPLVPLGAAAPGLDAGRAAAGQAAPTPLDPADARLVELADAAEALERACNAFSAKHRGRETDETEAAFGELSSGFSPLEEQIEATPAATITGLLAKVRASRVPTMRAFEQCPFALSIADDLWRLFGEVTPVLAASDGPTDPFARYPTEIMALQATIRATDEDSPKQEAAWDRWKEIDGLVLGSHPTTLAGAVGAIELARREHHQFSIEDRQPDQIGTDDRLIQHALVGALAVLRPLADRGAPPQANLRPAPLPTGMLAGRYPVGATREEIETYRTFLDMELRYLNWEIYGRTEGRLHLWMDNPAADLHGPGQPPASSRAAAVLGLLGLTPTPGVDGRAQAEGLARVASAA